MGSNPLFIIPDFFLYFSLEPSYGYFRFEGNGKFLWEGREYGGERNGHWIDILRYLYPFCLSQAQMAELVRAPLC